MCKRWRGGEREITVGGGGWVSKRKEGVSEVGKKPKRCIYREREDGEDRWTGQGGGRKWFINKICD